MSTKPRTHECAAEGCVTEIAHHLLMCPRHWRMLPVPLRRDVLAHWQDLLTLKPDAVAGYREAVDEAVRTVARMEQNR